MSFVIPPEKIKHGAASVAWKNTPAHGEEVGGDALFLETERTDGRELYLYGDVCGHGPEAAEINTVLLDMLQTDDKLRNLSPAELLNCLHSRLAPVWLSTERHVAASAWLIAPQEVILANAGQPPPILCSMTQNLSVHEMPPALYLGWPIESDPLQEVTISTSTLESLWMCSDGIFDSISTRGDRLGPGGFCTLMRDLRQAEGEQLDILTVMSQISEWSKPQWPEDDASIVVIQVI